MKSNLSARSKTSTSCKGITFHDFWSAQHQIRSKRFKKLFPKSQNSKKLNIEGARPRGYYSFPGQLCDRRNNPKERAQLGLGTRLPSPVTGALRVRLIVVGEY